MEFSREFGLAPNVIEKDYALGWVLAGIANTEELSTAWVFKGGTALKKCFFETYRFSEDLDFTVADEKYLAPDSLTEIFHHIADWVYEQAGIEIPRETIRFEGYTNPRGKISVQGRIGYRGPLKPGGDLPRIRFDLTNDELVVLNPEMRVVHHPHSDSPTDGIHILCYPFEEVFAEKIRALAERERPRDLYDVIHLYRHSNESMDRSLLVQTLEKKCAFKGMPLPTLDTLASSPEYDELRSEWKNMLAHQLPMLPPFEQFWDELPKIFNWLYGKVEKEVQSLIPSIGIQIDDRWRAPIMATAWHTKVPFEIIRYAGANRLCVDLQYQGSKRLIEPYSLRRSRDGNLLLYAVKHLSGEPRSYRADRIEGATVTDKPFIPRFTVELSESGPISAPPISRNLEIYGTTRPRKPVSRSLGISRLPSGFGPKYVFECPVCSKRFTHKSYDGSLNPHKDKHGIPCGGRHGIYIGIK
jgi:predicted nucleotidyltransferase component of viral defense system